jgi:hypothetical protein
MQTDVRQLEGSRERRHSENPGLHSRPGRSNSGLGRGRARQFTRSPCPHLLPPISTPSLTPTRRRGARCTPTIPPYQALRDCYKPNPVRIRKHKYKYKYKPTPARPCGPQDSRGQRAHLQLWTLSLRARMVLPVEACKNHITSHLQLWPQVRGREAQRRARPARLAQHQQPLYADGRVRVHHARLQGCREGRGLCQSLQ